MKVKTKLIGLFSGLFLLTCGIVGYVGYTSATGILEEKAKEKLEMQVFHTTDKLDRMLFERYKDMQFMAADPVISSAASSPEQISVRLKEFMNMNQLYLSLAYFDLKRTRIADTSGANIGKQHAFTEYWPGIAEGRDFVLLIAMSETVKKVVVFSAYVVKDKNSRPMGVVVSMISVDSLYKIIRQAAGIRPTEKEMMIEIELVDKNGLVLYSDYENSKILTEVSDDWDAIKGFVSQGAKVGSIRHYHEGEDEIAAFAQEQGYLDFKGNEWILKICTPSETVFADLFEQRNKFLAIFSVIGFIVLIGILLLSLTLTKPLEELNAAAGEIGRGNLNIHLKERSKDEIGQLVRVVNQMVVDLKASTEELQHNDDITKVINSLLTLSLKEIPLENILDRALEDILSLSWLVLQRRGSIFLVDDDAGELVMKASNGLDEIIQKRCARVHFGRCLCGLAAATAKLQFAARIDERHEVNYEGMSPHGHYCIPILSDGKTHGVLNLYLQEGHPRIQKEEDFLTALASALAGVITRKQGEETIRQYQQHLEELVRERTAGLEAEIAEHRQAEDALRQSEERFRQAMAVTQDGLWEWNILTNQEFFAPRWCEIIGYSYDDPELPHSFDSWASRIHPDDYERVMSVLKDHLEKGAKYDVDYRHRHKSGEYRWQNSRGQALFDESGKPVKMVGCISDSVKPILS